MYVSISEIVTRPQRRPFSFSSILYIADRESVQHQLAEGQVNSVNGRHIDCLLANAGSMQQEKYASKKLI